MGEIRLICPKCGIEYQIPAAALPDGGREVECSECGCLWRALPPQSLSAPMELGVYSYNLAGLQKLTSEGSSPADAPETSVPPLVDDVPPVEKQATDVDPEAIEPPPPRRRIPESVLNILLEEVEHERRAREADEARAEQPLPQAEPELDWPATTVTELHDPLPKPAEIKKPAPPVVAEPVPVPVPAEPVSIIPEPAPVIAESAPVAAELPQAVPPVHSGYWSGFSVAAGLAAALVALYLLAPSMADSGPVGQALADLRQDVDHGRLWLQGSTPDRP